MPLSFEWDTNKARTKVSKHGVSFEEATPVLGNPLSLTIRDPAPSETEDRFVIPGRSYRQPSLVVVGTERGDNVRVIRARPVRRRERKDYEQSA